MNYSGALRQTERAEGRLRSSQSRPVIRVQSTRRDIWATMSDYSGRRVSLRVLLRHKWAGGRSGSPSPHVIVGGGHNHEPYINGLYAIGQPQLQMRRGAHFPNHEQKLAHSILFCSRNSLLT